MKKLWLWGPVLAVVLSGCAITRAEVGIGLGLGAEIKVPGLFHTGLAAGTFRNWGYRYYWGRHWRSVPRRMVALTTPLWHWEGYQGTLTLEERLADEDGDLTTEQREAALESPNLHHACFGVLPPLTSYGRDQDGRTRDPWSLEIGLMLGFFDLHLGLNLLGGIP